MSFLSYVKDKKNCDNTKMLHFCFNFDACQMHSPFRFVHLTRQRDNVNAPSQWLNPPLQLTHHNLGTSIVICHYTRKKKNAIINFSIPLYLQILGIVPHL